MKKCIALLLVLCICSPAALAEQSNSASFTYVHDPRENPVAMRDIVENPAAVYGFSPSPAEESTLKDYADLIDWTDPAQVAVARAERTLRSSIRNPPAASCSRSASSATSARLTEHLQAKTE